MHNLQRYPQLKTQNYSVQALSKVQQQKLIISFEVHSKLAWNTNEEFSKQGYQNWGLWNFDVVEAFVSGHKNHLPYLELQVSPLGQAFALVIERPRQKYAYPETLSLQVTSQVEGNIWKATLEIDLKDIPGFESEVFGNLHACLGTGEEREFFALNPSDKIDFHRPEFFSKLGSTN